MGGWSPGGTDAGRARIGGNRERRGGQWTEEEGYKEDEEKEQEQGVDKVREVEWVEKEGEEEEEDKKEE